MTRSTEQLRERVRTLEIALQSANWEAAKADLLCLKELLAVREAQSVPVAWQAESKVRCNRMTTLNKEVAADWAFKGFTVTPLYTVPPAPAVIVNFKALVKDLVENLVDCDGADEEAVEQYLAYAEKTCRAAMLQPGAG